jgi:probable HAF family extracellular repeat protein
MTDLAPQVGYPSFAIGVNSTGQVVGVFYPDSGSYYNAFLYSSGTSTNLGTLGGKYSWAEAINNTGQVVGFSTNSSGYTYAFLYSGGTMINLGKLGGDFSEATAINSAGQVVGISDTSSGTDVAFLYTAATGMENLNTLYASLLVSGTGSQTGFVSLTQANAINAAGEIAGYGMYWTGTQDEQEAFLLDVPEPSAWALLLSGSLLLLASRRRLRRAC